MGIYVWLICISHGVMSICAGDNARAVINNKDESFWHHISSCKEVYRLVALQPMIAWSTRDIARFYDVLIKHNTLFIKYFATHDCMEYKRYCMILWCTYKVHTLFIKYFVQRKEHCLIIWPIFFLNIHFLFLSLRIHFTSCSLYSSQSTPPTILSQYPVPFPSQKVGTLLGIPPHTHTPWHYKSLRG